MIGGAITRNNFAYSNIEYVSDCNDEPELDINNAFVLFSKNFFSDYVQVLIESVWWNSHMPFNGDSLVDIHASDFGTVTRRADKLFYSMGKQAFPVWLLFSEGKNSEFS
jgi:hypothetical protein